MAAGLELTEDERTRSGGGRTGAGGGQAAGDRTGRTQTVQWSWRRLSGPRQRRGGGRSGAGGGQAAGDRTGRYSGVGGGRVDPGSTAEQKYRSRTLHTLTCIIQYASGWEVASYIIQLACRWKHVRRMEACN